METNKAAETGTGQVAHFHRGQLLPQILETLNSGLRVQVTTYTQSTVYDQRHIGMFKAIGNELYIQRGRKWLCYDGASVRFERAAL